MYIIRWNFPEDGTPTLDITFHYNIPITYSIDGTIYYVKYLYTTESFIYLGYTSQPGGN